MILKAAACALAVLLLHAPAAAAPCETSVALTTDTPAPCAGLLIPEADARSALHCLGVGLPRCRADMALCSAEAAAHAKGSTEMLAACDEHRARLLVQIDEALSIEPRAWWDSPASWFAGGAAVGAGVVMALVYGLSSL